MTTVIMICHYQNSVQGYTSGIFETIMMKQLHTHIIYPMSPIQSLPPVITHMPSQAQHMWPVRKHSLIVIH